MAANYVLLASQTVGAAGASSVTFSNIPQTGYTDLKIVGSARTTASAFYGYLAHKLNNSGTGYTAKAVDAYAGTVYSETGPTDLIRIDVNGNTSTSSTFGSYELYIPNYTSSNYKSYSYDWETENNSTSVYLGLTAGLWSNATAISSIVITPDTGTIMQYSSFYLYGIAALGVTPVIAPFATGGNVTNDGTYWIHTFLASGTFTPLKTLSCDYLVVAGGAGGGSNNGGGGGAGGFLTNTGLSIGSSSTVTVGAGGTGSLLVANKGGNGSDSVLKTITSTGGGGGGSGSNANGNSGGSGGGGAYTSGTAGAGNTPSTSPSQGNAGYLGSSTPTNYPAGGGGGATAAATNSNGGNGTSNSYSGSAVTYAGGGGGGQDNFVSTGGTGGGGNGGKTSITAVQPTAGTTNLGGGGGGGTSAPGSGANGGSGIVIVRYAMV